MTNLCKYFSSLSQTLLNLSPFSLHFWLIPPSPFKLVTFLLGSISWALLSLEFLSLETLFLLLTPSFPTISINPITLKWSVYVSVSSTRPWTIREWDSILFIIVSSFFSPGHWKKKELGKCLLNWITQFYVIILKLSQMPKLTQSQTCSSLLCSCFQHYVKPNNWAYR